MSLTAIRAAFEKRLKTDGLPIAYQNVEFKVPVSGQYYEFYLLPATPVDAVLGDEFFFEVGIAQITLVYPSGKGTGAAEGRAEQIRDLFPKGLTLIEDGIQVNVVKTPAIARGFPEAGSWRIPITVSWQAQIFD